MIRRHLYAFIFAGLTGAAVTAMIVWLAIHVARTGIP